MDRMSAEEHSGTADGCAERRPEPRHMLLRQTLLYLPSQLAGPAMQLAFAIIWTHWLVEREYGLLTLLIAGQELIYLCCGTWWSLYVLRYLGGADEADIRTIRRAEPGILFATCLLQVLLTLGTLAFLGWLHHAELVFVSIAYVIGRSLVVYLGERVRTQANILLYTIAQTGSLALGGLLGFLLILATPDAASVLAGFALAHLAVALWLVRTLNIGGLSWSVDTALLRKALIFGLPLIAANVINWVNFNGIRVVVEMMGGTAMVGLLAVGWGLGQRLSTTIAMLVVTAVFPLAAKSIEQGRRDLALGHMRQGGTVLVGLVLPATAGLCVITPDFVELLISAPFRDATLLILPMAIVTGAIRNIRAHYADGAFILFERTRLSVLVNAVEAVAMVGLCALGYAWGGLHGAVMGALVAATLGAVLGFGIAWRMGLPMPMLDWGRIALASAIMAGLVAAATPHLQPFAPITRILVEGGLGLVLYAGALACLFPLRLRDALTALNNRAPGPLACEPAGKA